jgi:hypothetical protein
MVAVAVTAAAATAVVVIMVTMVAAGTIPAAVVDQGVLVVHDLTVLQAETQEHLFLSWPINHQPRLMWRRLLPQWFQKSHSTMKLLSLPSLPFLPPSILRVAALLRVAPVRFRPHVAVINHNVTSPAIAAIRIIVDVAADVDVAAARE